jgi:hypothetical protein
MTDSREKALEKCIAHVKEFLSEYDGDGGSCNIRVCGKPDDPHFFALTKRFPYATPKPIPKKGTIVMYQSPCDVRWRLGWSNGETDSDGWLEVGTSKNAVGELRKMDAFENWRVVGNGEEERRIDDLMLAHSTCTHCRYREIPTQLEPCRSCTTTNPSNWEGE